MKKKILITGSLGQLGSALFNTLSKDFNVLGTSRKSTQNQNIREMDVSIPIEVESIFNTFNPDIVINCAAYTNVDGSEINKELAYNVNVKGLRNIIQNSQPSTYIIQISSDYVYDGKKPPYIESDHTYPLNYYGKTKLEAENILRGSNRDYLILRPNVLYSNELNSKANFFAWVYNQLNANKSIKVVNDQISNPTYINDMVKIVFQGILMNYSGILNVGSEDSLSRYDFAVSIAKIFNFNINLIEPVSTTYLKENIHTYIAKRPLDNTLIVDKMENELNITSSLTNYNLKLIKQNI